MKSIDAQITFLYVASIAEAADFYERALGLTCALDQGGCRIYGVADSAFVGVCERPGRVQPGGCITTFVTDDVDGWAARLRDAGYALDDDPRHNDEYGIYHFFVRDPDGNLLEVQRFDDPRWSEMGD